MFGHSSVVVQVREWKWLRPTASCVLRVKFPHLFKDYKDNDDTRPNTRVCWPANVQPASSLQSWSSPSKLPPPLSVNGRHKRHRRHRKKYTCQRCCTGTHHNLKNVRTLKMQKCRSPPGLYILYCYAFTCQNPFHKLATPSDLTVLEKQSKSPV